MIYKSLIEIQDQFDVFLFDVYGVIKIHGKDSPAVFDVMKNLMADGKGVSILSNNTAIAAKVVDSYAKKGMIQGVHYQELLTSGQVLYEIVQADKLEVPGHKVYVPWTANHKSTDPVPVYFKDSKYRVVGNLAEADFICSGIPLINGEDQEDINVFVPDLKKMVASGLLMVCPNPDLKAAEGGGKFVVRQGAIAALYEQMGGKVIYYGKPNPNIFDRALKRYGAVDRSRVLMIGDTFGTDILGANRAGIKNCLMLEGGVTAYDMTAAGISVNEHNIRAVAKKEGVSVDFICDKVSVGPLFPGLENVRRNLESGRNGK